MKEITRIHIAKVAYDIELDAKKDIQEYMAALERYASDSEIMGDIEIRVTELLAERGVLAGGVITGSDVTAIRAQLGEPSDFAPEGEEVQELHDEPRRVYRDTDNAVLGGVLSGLGRFAGVDPLWVRLIFIVVLIVSFGTATVIYLILWLIIPPAATVAEKLRMSGQPVTLASIKALGEKAEPTISQTALAVRRLLRVGTGLALILGAIGALAAVGAVALKLFLGMPDGPTLSYMSSYEARWTMAVFALFALAGVLLSALCMVLASATLHGIWNRRISTAVVAITAAGLIAFAGGVGTMMYGRIEMQAHIDKSLQVTHASLPTNFQTIKKLTVLADDSGIGVGNMNLAVVYTVSDRPRYELNAPTDVKPEIVVAEDGLSATVKVVNVEGDTWRWGYMGSAELRIYGPQLDQIELGTNAPSVRYDSGKSQMALDAHVKGAANLELLGTYETVSLMGEDSGVIDMKDAVIKSLTVNNKGGVIEAGVVRELSVTVPDACRAAQMPDEPNIIVRVQAVSSDKLVYNGTEQAAKTIINDCGRVIIGDEEAEGEEL